MDMKESAKRYLPMIVEMCFATLTLFGVMYHLVKNGDNILGISFFSGSCYCDGLAMTCSAFSERIILLIYTSVLLFLIFKPLFYYTAFGINKKLLLVILCTAMTSLLFPILGSILWGSMLEENVLGRIELIAVFLFLLIPLAVIPERVILFRQGQLATNKKLIQLYCLTIVSFAAWCWGTTLIFKLLNLI